MKQPRTLSLCIFLFLLVTSLSPRAMAQEITETAPMQSETISTDVTSEIPIEEAETESNPSQQEPPQMGWLTVQASFPTGSSGEAFVSLQHSSTGHIVLLHTAHGSAEGQWLPEGTYSVLDVDITSCNHLQVSYNPEVEVSRYCDGTLAISVTEDIPTELLEQQAAFIPEAVAPPSREQKIGDFLLELIGNPYGTAGLIGNLCAESDLNAQNLQDSLEAGLGHDDQSYTIAVDSGSYLDFVNDQAGYGLAQWTYPDRKQGLLELAHSLGSSIGSLDTQLQYIAQELSGSRTMTTLQNAESVQEACDAVFRFYLSPHDLSDDAKDARYRLCENYFNRFGSAAQLTQEQKDIIQVASDPDRYGITASCGQQWVAQVFSVAGLPTDDSCCPYHAGQKYGSHTDWNQITPGSAVYGYSGSDYGHVGIYVGKGQVYHYMDGHQIDTLADWVSKYQGYAWGSVPDM